jgi:hypothetical protein
MREKDLTMESPLLTDNAWGKSWEQQNQVELKSVKHKNQ